MTKCAAGCRAHSDEIAGFFPPGLAKVTTAWPSDDRMDITAEVLGYAIPGGVDVRDGEVVITMDLPMILGLMRGPLEHAVKKERPAPARPLIRWRHLPCPHQ